MGNDLEIIPLGGIGEFGMNCMSVRYGDEMIILDAGMGFPEETAYGVDISIPNFEFLEEYRDNIVAIVLTHGHEDHLGALPFILKKFNVPVYCSHFTAGLAESKLEEHDLLGDTLIHRVSPRDGVSIGPGSVEFIRVSHSLVDCFSLAIKTPVGTIIHTGDYKVDETPVIGEPIDLRSFRRYGQEGVLALLSDSTTLPFPGARLQSEPSFLLLKKYLQRLLAGSLSLRLLRQSIACKSSSTSHSSLIAKSASWGVRCKKMSRLQSAWDTSTFRTACSSP